MAGGLALREQLEQALAVLADVGPGDPVARGEALYAHWYARPRRATAVPAGCPPNLVEMLRAAHAGFCDWEDGWRVETVGPRGRAVVRRGGELRLLDRSDYSPVDRAGLLPRPGDRVSVTRRRDYVDPGGGWWRTGGRAWSWLAAPPGLVRLYVDCDVPGLPALVARVTGLLADEPDPWLVKCAVDPALYARSDAFIVYLTPGVLARRAGAIAELATGDAHPPLTLPVARGIAAAFDPGGDESFGGHRCRLIAEAGATVEAVLERFAAAGVDPARPWARREDPRLPWEH